MKSAEHPQVSVIIPAKNEAKLLPECLSSLARQRTDIPYEVIVVDTNSEDGTRAIAESFGARVVNEPRLGRIYAFRTGVNVARGSVYCFAEADCILPANWIQVIVDYLAEHPEVTAISGTYTFHSSTLFYNFLASVVHRLAQGVYFLLFGSVSLRCSNSAIRKEVYRAVGGFADVYFELYDVELGRRVGKIGKIHHVPGMEIQTSDRRFRGRILRFIVEFVSSFIRDILLKRPLQSPTYEDIR